jgi:hypothetical protein
MTTTSSIFPVTMLFYMLFLTSCTHIPLPTFADKVSAQQSANEATPRELLGARLVNPPANENIPRLTIGKLIEYADRYLACDCAGTRFVRAWAKTPNGYRLLTNSPMVKPLELVCRETSKSLECFLKEIDRGASAENLRERFVPGSEFINFLYENGVRCDGTGQCP